jgi:hypothetical protein
MFDNLREDSSLYEEDSSKSPFINTTGSSYTPKPSKQFLGMTSMQRFLITFMLMIAVVVIGIMFLFAMGKIGF